MWILIEYFLIQDWFRVHPLGYTKAWLQIPATWHRKINFIVSQLLKMQMAEDTTYISELTLMLPSKWSLHPKTSPFSWLIFPTKFVSFYKNVSSMTTGIFKKSVLFTTVSQSLEQRVTYGKYLVIMSCIMNEQASEWQVGRIKWGHEGEAPSGCTGAWLAEGMTLGLCRPWSGKPVSF